MRASIKSIARDLNISHMTVSRALSDHPNVSAEMRGLVLRRAEEVGYVKNRAAYAMRGEASAIVGLLLPNITNEFYARFANQLGLLCADAGLDLLVHLTNDDSEREKAGFRRLAALQASSVILVPAPGEDDIRDVVDEDTHVIELIRSRRSPASSLLVEDEAAIRRAVHHLASNGCRNIGYIGASETLSSGRRRQAAYIGALEELQHPLDTSLIRLGYPGREFGLASMTDLLNSKRPDAVLCGGFEISDGALEACLNQGIVFPRDLAFVGYGDPELYRWLAGGITTIGVDPEDLAAKALEMIHAGPSREGPSSRSSGASLVVRKSA